jgi:hypothetical protein
VVLLGLAIFCNTRKPESWDEAHGDDKWRLATGDEIFVTHKEQDVALVTG